MNICASSAGLREAVRPIAIVKEKSSGVAEAAGMEACSLTAMLMPGTGISAARSNGSSDWPSLGSVWPRRAR